MTQEVAMSAGLQSFTPPPLQLLQRPLGARAVARPAATAVVPPAPRTTWLERLAGWAERQPGHHRMGSLDAHRHA
jgi:hypothetical protein